MGDPVHDPSDDITVVRRRTGGVQTPEAAKLLEEARGIIDRKNARELKPKGAENKLREQIGEYGARRYVDQNFRGRIKREIIVPRRGERGPHILDLVYELDTGEIVVLEVKQGRSRLGKVNKKAIRASDTAPMAMGVVDKRAATRMTLEIERKAIVQFSPQWFQDRLKEIRAKDHRLANKIERAWYDGRLTALVVHVDDDGMVRRVVDKTQQWTLFKQRAVPEQRTVTPHINRTAPSADLNIEAERKPEAAPKEVDVVPNRAPEMAVGETPDQPTLKSRMGGPKVKLALKVGATVLLDIGVGLIDSWFEGSAQKEGWEEIEPQVNRLAQAALGRATQSGEIARFRTGEGLRVGYQLYYRIRLKVNTRCNDGPFGYSAYFVSFEPLGVDVVRNMGHEPGFPKTGVDVACDKRATDATLYSPLFTIGEQIGAGTVDAAEERFRPILSTLTRSYVGYHASNEYLTTFHRYTRYFRDCKAAFLWADLVEDIRFQKVLAGAGLINAWDLVDAGLSLEEVIETVPWREMNEIPFIKAFLENAERRDGQNARIKWKKYYDRLASYNRGRLCNSTCQLPSERGLFDPVLFEDQPFGGASPFSRISAGRYPGFGGH